MFNFSLQGLAHLKAEQGTLFFVFVELYYVFLFPHRLAWFWGVILCCVLSLPVRVHLCVAMLPLFLQRSVCVCVLVGRDAWRHGMFLISTSSLSLSVSLRFCVSSPSFHPGFCVLHNCVLFSVPQLTCSDTLHCSCSTSAATGEERGEGGG